MRRKRSKPCVEPFGFFLCLVCICLLRCNHRENVVINIVVLFVDPKMNQKRCQVSVICYLFCDVLSCNVVCV